MHPSPEGPVMMRRAERMRRPRGAAIHVASAMLVATAVATGCADESSPSRTAATSRPSASDSTFDRHADAILCQRDHRIAAIALGHVLSGDDATAEADAAREILPTLHETYDRLSALRVSRRDEARVREVLETMRGALAEADADPSSLNGPNDPFGRVDRALEARGFHGCD